MNFAFEGGKLLLLIGSMKFSPSLVLWEFSMFPDFPFHRVLYMITVMTLLISALLPVKQIYMNSLD